MSDVNVPVALIEDVQPHPNADKLEVATILGWQVVVGKGTYQPGSMVVYVPPDSFLEPELADRFGVTSYLSRGRVKSIKLRGEPSFGFTVPLPIAFPDQDVPPVGTNVAELLGITKYNPPIARGSTAWTKAQGYTAAEHPLFTRYTDVENLRHYPNIFEPGEQVVVTEKIHGANSRIGIIEGEWMAGSRRIQRKRPEDDDLAGNMYWMPWTIPGVKSMMGSLAKAYKQVILYGELYGSIQTLHYGHPNDLAYVAFDILVDGRYMGELTAQEWMDQFGVKRVPQILYAPFDLDRIKKLASGPTFMNDQHYREGVVVRPVKERYDKRIGRVILKYVSDEYLLGASSKEVAEDSTVRES